MTINWVSRGEWAEELRRNPPQTQGCLRSFDREGNVKGECCLGVLCRISGADYFLNPNPYSDKHSLHNSIPIRFLPEWMGSAERSIAIHLNDNLGCNFSEIAEWVERGMPHTLRQKNEDTEK